MARQQLMRNVLRRFTWLFAGCALFVLMILLLFRFVNPPTSAFMLAYLVTDSKHELQQEWVPLSGISPWMPLAVIASEDQRFPVHHGVDFTALGKAVSEYKDGRGLRGASTITQQTAKNLFLWNGRSFVRKGLEAGLAVAIDAFWPKRRILEVYLNIAEFGPGIYGVEAASRKHFGVTASQLSQNQAARLAAVLPNPQEFNAAQPSAYVWDRVAWIRQQMKQLSGLRYLQDLEE